MATVRQYKAYEEVLGRVNDVRMRATVNRILDGTLGAAALASVAVLGVTACQATVRFGSLGREVLRVALWVGLVAAVVRLLLTVVRRPWTDERTARFIETRVPDIGNSLINVIQLVEESRCWSPVLLDRAMSEAARGVRGRRLGRVVSWRRVLWLASAAVVACGLLTGFALGAPGAFRSALDQVLSPYDFVPTRGGLSFTVQPGNVQLVRGQRLRVTVQLDNPAGQRPPVWLFVRGDGDEAERRLPLAAEDDTFALFGVELPEISAPLVYRVEVARDQSERFRVLLREKPIVSELTVACEYPSYTGLARQRIVGATGNLRVPAGTGVTLTVTTSGPVRSCTLHFDNRRDLQCVSADSRGTAWQGQWKVVEDDRYQIEIVSMASPVDGNEIRYTIEAVPDEPPTVAVRLPGRDVSAPPGGTVDLLIRARDDYGFKTVRLYVSPEGAESSEPSYAWREAAVAGKLLALRHGLTIPATAKVGSVWVYHAEATDNLTYQGGPTPRQPHEARSEVWRVTVEDPRVSAQSRLTEARDLYDRLQKLLDAQREARRRLGSLAQLAAEDVVAAVRDVATRQQAIRASTLSMTQEVRFDRDTAAVKATLERLAYNPMRRAQRQAAELAEIAETRADRPKQHALAETQNEIIVVLERLLDMARGRVGVATAELGGEGSDLPPEVEERLRRLAETLQEFTDQQKKVIEESEKLAKKPVDDFTAEDRAKLKELAATEDRWEKFLAATVSELSKLPVLDASNTSLLTELIEVQYDLEMARGALKKDAVEVAVALENAGAELAEEIVENLERWLPDEPDRIKWSMEEPPEPMEIPHAELPEQLEDIVGELLEQEEDLFDEMEDVTSGWADSLDKGAGWDALDGPISNYSARGVTGNQLPNTSEIGGRSGEGRTGKASGEMVEETATGKGGRRTPTRVTADPFQKGEVTDTSQDPPGGATGGGKVSGGGNEGLEGPVPRETERKMQRLKGRQAALRSTAERINITLKVSNYESFNLDEALRSMRRVEREIAAGRYRNAMREKHVLLNQIKTTRALLKGEIHVRSDRRADLPEAYRREIEEADRAPMPEGYQALVKQYHRRLTRDEPDTAAP